VIARHMIREAGELDILQQYIPTETQEPYHQVEAAQA